MKGKSWGAQATVGQRRRDSLCYTHLTVLHMCYSGVTKVSQRCTPA
jgi:hypothetical protein